jgi:hypothetical protein
MEDDREEVGELISDLQPQKGKKIVSFIGVSENSFVNKGKKV